MLHRCIEGEKVGVDGSKIVDVDHRHDPCPDGTPAPPRERGREHPSFFFLGLPLDGRRVPPLVHGLHGSPSLFSSISRSPDLTENRFLYSRRSVTPIALRFEHVFFRI